MEYLASERDNEVHMEAVKLLRNWVYRSYGLMQNEEINAY